MTRILNFAILFMLGSIVYVKTDGFGANVHATVNTTQQAAVKPEPEPTLITPAKVVVKEPTQAQVKTVTATDPNALTKPEKDAIAARFLAQRLAASTVIRTVKSAKKPSVAEPTAVATAKAVRMIVAGKVVNARSEPTTSSQVLAKLRRGTEVVPTGKSDGAWAQVIVTDTGQPVWMHSDFLTQKS